MTTNVATRVPCAEQCSVRGVTALQADARPSLDGKYREQLRSRIMMDDKPARYACIKLVSRGCLI
jgi:hypothetical protein